MVFIVRNWSLKSEMAHQLLAALTCFVLLWTGTLLHDLFFDDDGDNHSALCAQHSYSEHTCLTDSAFSNSHCSAEPHWHGPIATSQADNMTLSSHRTGNVFFAESFTWIDTLPLAVMATYQRPPPPSIRASQLKLYLLNRSLLI